MPNVTYPPGPPSVSGDIVSINRFLNTPTLIQRRLRTLAEQRFISDRILTSRGAPSGGAIQFEQNEGIFPLSPPESIQPGQEFPLTDIAAGPSVIKSVDKYGFDTIVTDESIRRQFSSPVDRAMLKMANGIVQKIDAIALAAIAAAPTQTLAGSSWAAANATIIEQIIDALNMITSQNQGYEPDTVIIDDTRWANMMKNANLRTALPRETNAGPVQTGELPTPLLGIRNWFRVPSSSFPTANTVMVLDASQLGGMADEVPLTAQSMRNEERQRWRLRVYRITVPYVNEPNAAVVITGV